MLVVVGGSEEKNAGIRHCSRGGIEILLIHGATRVDLVALFSPLIEPFPHSHKERGHLSDWPRRDRHAVVIGRRIRDHETHRRW